MTLGPSGIGRLPVAFWQTPCQSRALVCVAKAAAVLMPESMVCCCTDVSWTQALQQRRRASSMLTLYKGWVTPGA